MAPTPHTRRNRAMSIAVASAVALLRDPEMRDQLAKAGSGLADQVRRWNDERRGPAARDGSITVVADGLEPGHALPRFVVPQVEQRRLERRVSRLTDTVQRLRDATGPRVATTFDEMDAAIERIRLALGVASNLPRSQRIASLDEVAVVLTSLESAVQDALLGGLTD